MNINSVFGQALLATVIYCVIKASNGNPGLENLFCESRPTAVHTQSHLFPYFVSLHRCNGGHSPAAFACVAAVEEDVEVLVNDRIKRVGRSIFMKNQTKCKSVCATKPSDCPKPNVFQDCKCRCPHPSSPKNIQCGPRKSWNRYSCGCVCNKKIDCPRRRYFEERTCSCKCKDKRKVKCERDGGFFQTDNCGCIRKQHQNSKKTQGLLENNQPFWISMFFAEFIILMLVFETFLYYKNHGVVYTLSKRWHKNNGPTQGLKVDLGKHNSVSTDNIVDRTNTAAS